MYNIIKNPETNRNVSIYSKKGIAILEKYLNNLTGGMRKMTPEDDPMDFKGSLNYDNIPPMFRNKYINKEGKEIKYKGYKNKLKNILEIIKKKSVQDQEKITEITDQLSWTVVPSCSHHRRGLRKWWPSGRHNPCFDTVK